jgi:hypothetical protein
LVRRCGTSARSCFCLTPPLAEAAPTAIFAAALLVCQRDADAVVVLRFADGNELATVPYQPAGALHRYPLYTWAGKLFTMF